MDILGGLGATITGTPWILREPAGPLHYGNGWKSWLRIRFGSHSRAVVANSSWGIQYWQSRCPTVWHRIIPNGFPLDEIAAVPLSGPGEWGIGPERKYILCAGRLAEQKNLINLIKAFSLVSIDKDVLLLICGEGPLRNSLIRTARKSGVGDNVRVSGFVPSSRLWSLMKGAELLVLASDYEGFPNVIAEAMICGCPLVVSDIPAHREFLDETMAVFVDPRDPRKIADAILDTLGDPEGARWRARNAREKSRKYSVEAMANAYEKVYREVVSRACADLKRKRS
jgi:glycosyltransferase involved in cell wall biosynthesis